MSLDVEQGGEELLSEEELERLRRKKVEELRRRIIEEEKRREIEAQKRAILRIILEPKARERLENLRLVKPELVENLENQLIALAQSGKIKVPITDNELKRILEEIYKRTHREFKIRFR